MCPRSLHTRTAVARNHCVSWAFLWLTVICWMMPDMWLRTGQVERLFENHDQRSNPLWYSDPHSPRELEKHQRFSYYKVWRLQLRHHALGTYYWTKTIRWWRRLYARLVFIKQVALVALLKNCRNRLFLWLTIVVTRHHSVDWSTS